MVNPSRLSRRFPPKNQKCFTGLLHVILLWLFLTPACVSADMPDYLRTALGKFSPQVPSAWAYTLTTESDKQQTTERFDPSKPPSEQWVLLRTGDHLPTREDLEKYFKHKASQAPGAPPAVFQKNDIEPGSFKLISEDSDKADFTCIFREQAANADKMLGHLGLRLTINKHQAYVEEFNLTLSAAYSPVLGVRMNELVVTMNFSAPAAGRPSLPIQSSSHFAGRIFFVPVEENLRFTYLDFAPAP
jgi:hypothetical protein